MLVCLVRMKRQRFRLERPGKGAFSAYYGIPSRLIVRAPFLPHSHWKYMLMKSVKACKTFTYRR